MSTIIPVRSPATPVSPGTLANGTSTKVDGHLLLPGVKVCHLSPVQNRRDARVFSRESLPAVSFGLRPVIVGPHSQRTAIEGVEFISLPQRGNRALRIISALRLVRSALPTRADIFHVHSPELIPAGLVLKFIFRKKVVYDSREDFPSMMLTKSYLPRRLRVIASKLVAALERLAARHLDGIVTADSGSLRPLAHIGSSKKLVFYNLPNLRYFPQPSSVEKAYDLVYRGGLSERAGTFVLLRALQILLDSGISARLLLFGYTDNEPAKHALNNELSALGIEHLVTLRGVIPHEDMAKTLASARVAVCPLQKIPKFMNNIPVKVFESWACGLPVIATDLPPIRPFFRGRPYGLLVKPGDSADLANAIRRLLGAPELIEEYGRQARRAVMERYNNAGEVRKLIRFYKRILPC